MKIIERIFDAQTGQTQDIERDMTAFELAEYRKSQEKLEIIKEQEKIQQEKKAIAEAKLAALGLTTEDLQVLGLA